MNLSALLIAVPSVVLVLGGLWTLVALTGTEDEKQTVTAAFRRRQP
jgi:hypothetical protein